MYRVLSREMADAVLRFFESQISSLLVSGFTSFCYDGQPFFDTGHPLYPNIDGTGAASGVSNIIGTGTGAAWFLLSLAGSLKPLILRQRTNPEFAEITDANNSIVFIKDQYLYGVRYRGSFGYGLWQQAVASKTALTAANFEAARFRMRTFKRDGGEPMGIVPTHLVVDPTNESAARAAIPLRKARLMPGRKTAGFPRRKQGMETAATRRIRRMRRKKPYRFCRGIKPVTPSTAAPGLSFHKNRKPTR
jgi:phage major head subunit gpT-like protein